MAIQADVRRIATHEPGLLDKLAALVDALEDIYMRSTPRPYSLLQRIAPALLASTVVLTQPPAHYSTKK